MTSALKTFLILLKSLKIIMAKRQSNMLCVAVNLTDDYIKKDRMRNAVFFYHS